MCDISRCSPESLGLVVASKLTQVDIFMAQRWARGCGSGPKGEYLVYSSPRLISVAILKNRVKLCQRKNLMFFFYMLYLHLIRNQRERERETHVSRLIERLSIQSHSSIWWPRWCTRLWPFFLNLRLLPEERECAQEARTRRSTGRSRGPR